MAQFQKKFTPELSAAQKESIRGAFYKSILIYNELLFEYKEAYNDNEIRDRKWLETPKDEWIIRRLLKDSKFRFAREIPPCIAVEAFRDAHTDLYYFNSYTRPFPKIKPEPKKGEIEITDGIMTFKKEPDSTYISMDYIGDHILLTTMKTYTDPVTSVNIEFTKNGVFVFTVTFTPKKEPKKVISLR